jgi:antitoxin MazE
MKVKIAKWGNSLGVRLPKAVTEGLSPGQTVEVRRKGSRVEIETGASMVSAEHGTPIPRYRLEDLIAEMDRVGMDNAPPTIDWGPDKGSEILPAEDFSYLCKDVPKSDAER